MYLKIYQNKPLLIVFFLVFIFQYTGKAYTEEKIPQRTADMIKTLKGIERADFQSAELKTLILEIFSNKNYQKQAEPLLNEFFLTEKKIAAKRYLMSELKKAGTPAAVNYLAELMTFDPSASLALIYLQDIPGEQVNKLLRSYYPRSSPKVKPGIFIALGVRQDEKSVSFISKYIHDEDSVISASAIYALGEIGTSKATASLTKALKSAGSENKLMLAEALLKNAEQLMAENQPDQAYEIYNTIRSVSPPTMIALATIKGKMNTSKENKVNILKQELTNASDELKPGLIDLVRILPDSYQSGRELLQLTGIPENEKVRLMIILSERNDKSIHEEVVKFLNHEQPVYRESAILALSGIADVESVPLLAKLASERTEREQVLARRSLYRLPGEDIDSLILKKADGADNESVKVEYIRAIGERNVTSAEQILIRIAKNENQNVRLESYRSLAKVSTMDYLGEIVELLLNTESSRELQELERTLILVSTKEGRENPHTKEIVARLKDTSEQEKKAVLISVLGSLKNPDDLEVLQVYFNPENTDLQLSAIRALSEWPNAGPAEGLKEIIGETDDLRTKTLALRGFTQVIVNDDKLSNEQKAQELLFDMSHVPNVNEKKLVISALGKVPSTETLRLLADEMSDNESTRPELEAAILNMTPQLIKQDRKHTIQELNRVLEYSNNDEIRKWTER